MPNLPAIIMITPGEKKIRVYNGLKPGEVVAMIRQRGGQQYLVVSRVHNHQGLSGQWGG